MHFKLVLEGYHRCPDSHDLSECHHLYDLGRHDSLNFDSERISETTLWDHLKEDHISQETVESLSP